MMTSRSVNFNCISNSCSTCEEHVGGWPHPHPRFRRNAHVCDSAVDFRIDGSAMTEMHRDRETDCREEVCDEAQR